MTTNQNHIPEPTSPTAVVVGKRDGETLVAMRVDNDDIPWALAIEGHCEWHSWTGLCREMTDIRVVPMAELDAKPEPGPWLRGDELKAIMPTLKAGDMVECCGAGTLGEFSGKLTSTDEGDLRLAGWMVHTTRGTVGHRLDALRIIERAPEPEPGVDIRYEVAAAAGEKIMELAGEFISGEVLLAALAAADAKRAELTGGDGNE